MFRIILLIFCVALAVMGLDWLSQQEGTVTVENFFGFQTRPFSLAEVFVALVALTVIAILLWSIVTAIWHAPKAVVQGHHARRKKRGYENLSRGMIAVGAGNAVAARRHARKSKRLLNEDPLADLLIAQSAQLAGDNATARQTYKQMLDKPETHLLGLHGLYMEAKQANETEAAQHYVNEAAKAAPNLDWAGKARFENLCATGKWDEALVVLQQNLKNRLIDKETAKRQRAVLLTGLALRNEDAEPDKARGQALEAHNLAPDLVPAAVVAARLFSNRGNIRKATNVIETTWKISPHPELAEAYARVRPGDSTRDRYTRIKTLAAMYRTHPESYLALAQAAIDAMQWSEARIALGTVLAEAPTQRSLAMMAELEHAEHDDTGAAREWLSRAVRAPKDAAWVAGNYVSQIWAPISPETGELDVFEWKAPEGGEEAAQTIILELQEAYENQEQARVETKKAKAQRIEDIAAEDADREAGSKSAQSDPPQSKPHKTANISISGARTAAIPVRGTDGPIDSHATNGAKATGDGKTRAKAQKGQSSSENPRDAKKDDGTNLPAPSNGTKPAKAPKPPKPPLPDDPGTGP